MVTPPPPSLPPPLFFPRPLPPLTSSRADAGHKTRRVHDAAPLARKLQRRRRGESVGCGHAQRTHHFGYHGLQNCHRFVVSPATSRCRTCPFHRDFTHVHNASGLLLAALRAEQRIDIFDISLAPLSGCESATMTPWRSYDVAEEVPASRLHHCAASHHITSHHMHRLTPRFYQAAAACWQPLPDSAPPCVLLSMMGGSFHSIHIRPVQVRDTRYRRLSTRM
jgi:hypothetical protein